MTRSLLLTCAALGLLAGCDVDDSLPSRPRQANFLTPDEKAQQNAEQRSLEKPGRDLPTNPTDLPGQSAAPAQSQVITADAAPAAPASGSNVLGFTGPKGLQAIGHTKEPSITYTHDPYPGLIPHVPLNPGTIPMTGATPMPGGDFAVGHDWGQGLTLTEALHRDWPTTTAHYEVVHAIYNPLYYTDLQKQLPVGQNNGSYCSDVTTGLIDIPWFYAQTMILPILMVFEPPFTQLQAGVPTPDPNYNGYLPGGPTVPPPVTSTLKWDYPFLNPDGTVKQSGGATTLPPSPPSP